MTTRHGITYGPATGLLRSGARLYALHPVITEHKPQTYLRLVTNAQASGLDLPTYSDTPGRPLYTPGQQRLF